MTDAQEALIRYRLEQAKATLQDARLLQEQGGNNWSIVNRAYYAMFYAALALMIDAGFRASKHSGVIALFDRHFVKTGLLPVEMSKWFHEAFELRQIGDYREFVNLDDEQVAEVVARTSHFVTRVERFLSERMGHCA